LAVKLLYTKHNCLYPNKDKLPKEIELAAVGVIVPNSVKLPALTVVHVDTAPEPPDVRNCPDVPVPDTTGILPVFAGNVSVVVPATAGAASVTVPEVSPAMITDDII
jgi:hypothetical protein